MTGVCDKASKARKCQADWRRLACKEETGDRLPEGEEDEVLGS